VGGARVAVEIDARATGEVVAKNARRSDVSILRGAEGSDATLVAGALA